MEFQTTAEVNTDDLAFELSKQLNYSEILDFIVTLDSYVSDWDFTEQLYKWAKGEHKTYRAEKKEFGS